MLLVSATGCPSSQRAIVCAKTNATRMRTFSIASSSLDDQLNCAVCLERFDDPRTLPCHHSFCLHCLSSVPRQEDQDCILIKCPTCCKPSQLPEGGVDQLPTAFLINNLLELQNNTEQDQEVCMMQAGNICGICMHVHKS